MSSKLFPAVIAVTLFLGGVARAQPQITVDLSFAGIPADGTAPPNTTGSIGATEFVLWVNHQYAIYNRNGNLLQSPRPGNSIWARWMNAGPCASNGSGDPMVEYDKAAGRWVFAQLTLTNPAYYCFAISTTSEARGPFYYYKFPFANGLNPSIPRLAVWSDAYYASFNIQPSGEAAAPMVVAYDRADMLVNGTVLTPVGRRPKKPARTYFLPADYDGATPPEPGDYYMEMGGDTFLTLWRFVVNFTDPTSSTFLEINKKIPITARGPGCSQNPTVWESALIPQEGTAQLLLAHPEQLMYRLAWRRLGGTEHLVANWTIILQSSPAVAAIQWVDIANPSSIDPTVNEGLVSDPADTNSYWIGSAAQDRDGNIALGFNASGPNMYPSIAIAGPLQSGTNPSALLVVPGNGSQTNTSLWGAHADLSLDPTDDCEFWFTAEYVPSTTPGYDWSTRVVKFHFNTCQSAQ